MSKKPNKKLVALTEENITSRDKVIETASRLYALKKELPSLAHQLGSLHNLPTEIEKNLDTLRKQNVSTILQEKEKSLISSIPKDKQEAVVNVLGETVLKEFPVSYSLNYYTTAATAMGSAAAISVIPVVGTVIAGMKIFKAMKQKKKFEKENEQKTTTARVSTNIFNEALQKMEFLLEDSEFQINEIANEISSLTESTKNYDMLSAQQKKEILDVIDKLSSLMQELKKKIEV